MNVLMLRSLKDRPLTIDSHVPSYMSLISIKSTISLYYLYPASAFDSYRRCYLINSD